MAKHTLSTGHKELDKILKDNKIIDQEDQAKIKFIEDTLGLKNQKEIPCAIQSAIQREIDAGIPPSQRTKFWFISCRCKKCNPFTF